MRRSEREAPEKKQGDEERVGASCPARIPRRMRSYGLIIHPGTVNHRVKYNLIPERARADH